MRTVPLCPTLGDRKVSIGDYKNRGKVSLVLCICTLPSRFQRSNVTKQLENVLLARG